MTAAGADVSMLTMDRYDALVAQLALSRRRNGQVRNSERKRQKLVIRELMTAASTAVPALRRGLMHADPSVRVGCCVVLDHHMDEATVPELVHNLTHDDPDVRAWA